MKIADKTQKIQNILSWTDVRLSRYEIRGTEQQLT